MFFQMVGAPNFLCLNNTSLHLFSTISFFFNVKYGSHTWLILRYKFWLCTHNFLLTLCTGFTLGSMTWAYLLWCTDNPLWCQCLTGIERKQRMPCSSSLDHAAFCGNWRVFGPHPVVFGIYSLPCA